jgi:hypothetical protein
MFRRDILRTGAAMGIDADSLLKSQQLISKNGHSPADEYTVDDYAYRDMLERKPVFALTDDF